MSSTLKRFLFSTVAVSLGVTCFGGGAQAAPTQITTPNIINVAGSTQATLGGATFVNQGLQGMGRITAGTTDFRGDTFGAFSGMDLLLSTWRKTAAGGYSGTLYALPDRGPNGVGQVTFSNYAGRINTIAMQFTPYTGAANLPAAVTSQNQIQITQTGGIVFRDFNNALTTGLDASGTTVQNGIRFPSPAAGSTGAGLISLDAEAVRVLKDGNFYVSDEYGANVYYFNSSGVLQGAILPPPALLPRDAQGNFMYTTQADAVTGRRFNQGLEGMAITPDSKKLVTLLQTGTYQDTTSNQQDRTNTRLMIYDISQTRTPTTPVADYVLQLPVYNSTGTGNPNRTAAQSELLALNDTQFLVLARDSNGLGQANGVITYKSVLLIDITGATNIAGTTYETSYTPLSPAGQLISTIRPVQQVELVNMLNATQLTKFGENLNNAAGQATRLTLGEKWEGMALAPVLEESAPTDYFLFVGNDNDFLASNCTAVGQNCSQAVNSDAHILVYRLTLPTYADAQNLDSMITGGPAMIEITGQAAVGVSGNNTGNIAAQMNAVRRAGGVGASYAWVSGGYRNAAWDTFTGPGMAAKRFGFQGTFGADFEVIPGVRVGAAAGYGANIGKVSGYKINAKGYGLSLYASGEKDGMFAHGGLTYSSIDHADISRPAAYGQTAVAAPKGSGWAGYVEAGYMFDAGLMKAGPVVAYRYADAKIDAYTETGASGGNVMYPRHTTVTATGSIGAEISGNWGEVSPYAQVFYNAAFNKHAKRMNLKLASVTTAMATQAVTIANTNENSVSAGVGLQGRYEQALWSIGYAADFGDKDRKDQMIRIGVGFSF